jgi:transposase
MAWGKVDVDEQRMRFVIAVSRGEKRFGELCKEFDISRPTGYQWWGRFQAGGCKAVVEKSRRPLREGSAPPLPLVHESLNPLSC